jgi:hypothetical protein
LASARITGLGGHFGHHVGLEHAAGRQAQEHVGALDHLGQRARIGLLGELDLVSSISSVRPS